MEKKTFCTKSRTQVFIIDSRTSNANVNATLDTRGDLRIRMNLDNNFSHPVVAFSPPNGQNTTISLSQQLPAHQNHILYNEMLSWMQDTHQRIVNCLK